LIAPSEAEGIAFFGRDYHAEFNFAGRLTAPVATPATLEDLALWQAAHPSGVIVADTRLLTMPWRPHDTVLFRNTPYAIWHVADAPKLEPAT
jgi:hypothetical protein